MSSEHEVECPMPDCTEALILQWAKSYALSPKDLEPLEDHEELITSAGAHSYSWQIECLAGHVVLLPTENLGCPCEDDQAGEHCPHYDDDYDWSEESRVFREHDVTRLAAVVTALTEKT